MNSTAKRDSRSRVTAPTRDDVADDQSYRDALHSTSRRLDRLQREAVRLSERAASGADASTLAAGVAPTRSRWYQFTLWG